MGIIGLCLGFLVAVFSEELAELMGNRSACLTIQFISPSILFVFISGILKGYLNGRSKFTPLAVAQIIEAVSKLIVGIVLAYIGVKLSASREWVAALSIIGISLGSLASDIYLYANYKNDHISNINIISGQNIEIGGKGMVKEIIRNAIPLTLSSSANGIFGVLEVGIIINGLVHLGMSRDSATALYGNYSTLSIPMITLVTSLLTPLSLTFLPKLVNDCVSLDNSRFNKTYQALYKTTLLLAAPIALIYALYSFDILDILFPSYNSAIGYLTLTALAPLAILAPILTVINTALEAKGLVFNATLSVILGLILRAVILITLINTPSYGILSAPIANTISYAFSVIFSSISLSIHGNPKSGFTKAFSEVLIPACLYAAAYYLLYLSGILGSGIYALLISLIVPTLLYLPMALIKIKRLLNPIT